MVLHCAFTLHLLTQFYTAQVAQSNVSRILSSFLILLLYLSVQSDNSKLIDSYAAALHESNLHMQGNRGGML